MPHNQFNSQTRRKRERIIRQREEARYGHRQTLPFKYTADYLANAQNNVRVHWIGRSCIRLDCASLG